MSVPFSIRYASLNVPNILNLSETLSALGGGIGGSSNMKVITSGSGTVVIPPSLNSIRVKMVGGGGGGGGAPGAPGIPSGGGGGGGGGCYAEFPLSGIGGNSYFYWIGAAGLGGFGDIAGGNGGNTVFGSLILGGGQGGFPGDGALLGIPGSGGSIVSGTVPTGGWSARGGDGSQGTPPLPAPSNKGFGGAGGSAIIGSPGGSSAAQQGSNGTNFGGGGGGAGTTSPAGLGGNGAPGVVIIYYSSSISF